MTTINTMQPGAAASFKGKNDSLKKLIGQRIPCPYSGHKIEPGEIKPPFDSIETALKIRQTCKNAKVVEALKENLKRYIEALDKLPLEAQEKVKIMKSIIERISSL